MSSRTLSSATTMSFASSRRAVSINQIEWPLRTGIFLVASAEVVGCLASSMDLEAGITCRHLNGAYQ